MVTPLGFYIARQFRSPSAPRRDRVWSIYARRGRKRQNVIWSNYNLFVYVGGFVCECCDASVCTGGVDGHKCTLNCAEVSRIS